MRPVLSTACANLLPIALLGALWASPGRAAEPGDPTLRAERRGRRLWLALSTAEGSHLADETSVRFEFQQLEEELSAAAEDPRWSGRGVPFRLGSVEATLDGVLRAAICTDDGSLCVQRSYPVELDLAQGRPIELALQRPTSASAAPEALARWLPETAAGLLLWDFYGVWCPPCDRLEAELLEAEAHRAALAPFTILRLDADHPDSFSAKEHFQVGGYPTLIVTDSDGTFRGRMVGYPGLEGALAFLDDVQRRPTLGALQARFDAGERDRALLVDLLTALQEAERSEGLLPVLEAISLDELDEAPRLARARARALTELEDDAALAAWRRALPQADRPADRSEALWGILGALPDDAEERATVGERIAELARARYEEEADPELLSEAAYALSRSGASEDAQQEAHRQAADAFVARLPGPEAAVERIAHAQGLYPSLFWSLRALGEEELLERYIRAVAAALPDDFGFQNGLTFFLHRNGRYEEALTQARHVRGLAYGDNLLRAVHLEATILQRLEQPEAARLLIEETLSGQPVPDEPGVRTHRYRDRLTQLLEEPS